MGNVIAIGLTPSRGIVIGPLLNAQLRHMSYECALGSESARCLEA